MTIPQLMPWIGGPVKFEAGLSPLVCPIDQSVASHMIESDAKVVDAAVKHAHTAFLKHQDATTAKRIEWLLAAADAIDKIESELVRSLIRFIGKPRRAATFEAKRVGTFMAPARHNCRISWGKCCRSTRRRQARAASASRRACLMAWSPRSRRSTGPPISSFRKSLRRSRSAMRSWSSRPRPAPRSRC